MSRSAPDPAAPATTWPEIATAHGVVTWTTTSVHPDLGPLRGRGLTRSAAHRSIVRSVRRRMRRG